MKTLTCVFGLVCALAVSGIASSAAPADEGSTAEPNIINYRVCNGPAPIHTSYDASSPTIGYLQNGEVFDVSANSLNNFDVGYAYGSVHHEGYMNRHYEC